MSVYIIQALNGSMRTPGQCEVVKDNSDSPFINVCKEQHLRWHLRMDLSDPSTHNPPLIALCYCRDNTKRSRGIQQNHLGRKRKKKKKKTPTHPSAVV